MGLIGLPLRIGLFGNICNNLYQIAKAVRQHSALDVHLYIDTRDDPQMRPESDDEEIKGHYPDWIHRGVFVSPFTKLAPWTSPLTTEMASLDMLVVSQLGPMFTQFVNRPTAFLVTGGDLTVLPFSSRYRVLSASRNAVLASTIVSYWQRRGILSCKQIWTQPFSPFRSALQDLKVPADRISTVYFPVVIDTQKIKYKVSAQQSQMAAVHQVVANADVVVFHPSRLMIQDHPYLKATGQWKQNDLLFRGFARFVRRSQAERAALVLIERPASFDVDLAKRIIADLGIEQNVLWLKPPRPFGFARSELIPLYSVADVVADDFGAGWFGSVVLEAFATERPVISYVDELALKQLYPWHPILSTNTVDGIADVLMKLYMDPTFRQQQGRLGRKWVEEFHSPENASQIYVKRFQEMTACL